MSLEQLRRNLSSINQDMFRCAFTLSQDTLPPSRKRVLEAHYSALTIERDEIEKKIDELLDNRIPEANIPV